MKTTFRILAACLAASLALVSCDKESLTKSDNGASKDGARVVTVSFSHTTKSGLGADGLTPHFTSGDVIKVFNGQDKEDCTVSVGADGTATISIQTAALKTGTLTAVYPADAYSEIEPYYAVGSSQDGTFAKANICTATITDGSNPKAEFENQTAILKFSVPAKADDKGVNYSPKTIKVKSRGSENIADGSNEITITGKGENGIITPSDGGFYYMAVLPGETISKLTVCSGEGMRCPTASGTLAANTIYDVALPVLNGHEYVELTIPVMTWDSGKWKYTPTGSTKTLRWATTNVGASETNPNGLYFKWGDTVGQTWNGSAWSSGGFGAPPILDPKNPEILPLKYDAANVNWGGSWRMPTREDFAGLAALDNKGWDNTDKGYKFTDANGNSIFLPAAGYGVGAGLNNAGGNGYYWSSSLSDDVPADAIGLGFSDGNINAASNDIRFMGRSVRPLSEKI